MKALTLWNPWALLLACGAKEYETRSWQTSYRGPIAIHAAATNEHWYADCDREYLRAVYNALKPVLYPDIMCNQQDLQDAAPYGSVIATAELVACHPICSYTLGGNDMGYFNSADVTDISFVYVSDKEKHFGDWRTGRYAWEFRYMTMLPEPVPAKGKQGLWNYSQK